jgi:hypothetical protein
MIWCIACRLEGPLTCLQIVWVLFWNVLALLACLTDLLLL